MSGYFKILTLPSLILNQSFFQITNIPTTLSLSEPKLRTRLRRRGKGISQYQKNRRPTTPTSLSLSLSLSHAHNPFLFSTPSTTPTSLSLSLSLSLSHAHNPFLLSTPSLETQKMANSLQNSMREEKLHSCRTLSKKDKNDPPKKTALSSFINVAVTQAKIRIKIPKLLAKITTKQRRDCDKSNADNANESKRKKKKKKRWIKPRNLLPKKVGSMVSNAFGHKKPAETSSRNRCGQDGIDSGNNSKNDQRGNEEELNGDREEELCKKRILMGGKCKPLSLSGALHYDQNGVLLPEVLPSEEL